MDWLKVLLMVIIGFNFSVVCIFLILIIKEIVENKRENKMVMYCTNCKRKVHVELINGVYLHCTDCRLRIQIFS